MAWVETEQLIGEVVQAAGEADVAIAGAWLLRSAGRRDEAVRRQLDADDALRRLLAAAVELRSRLA